MNTCPQCGAAFSCEVATGNAQCWCMAYAPVQLALQQDGRPLDCLCPACLHLMPKVVETPSAS